VRAADVCQVCGELLGDCDCAEPAHPVWGYPFIPDAPPARLAVVGTEHCPACGRPHDVYGYPTDQEATQ